MDHPIKRLRCNLETSSVRFETEEMNALDLLDYLNDLRFAFDAAYKQALQLPERLEETVPALQFRGGRLTPR